MYSVRPGKMSTVPSAFSVFQQPMRRRTLSSACSQNERAVTGPSPVSSTKNGAASIRSGQHAAQLHGQRHVTVHAQLAGHEGGSGILLALEDGLERLRIGGQGHVGVIVAGPRAILVDDDGTLALDDELGRALETVLAEF